jgi:hypothetical protein
LHALEYIDYSNHNHSYLYFYKYPQAAKLEGKMYIIFDVHRELFGFQKEFESDANAKSGL